MLAKIEGIIFIGAIWFVAAILVANALDETNKFLFAGWCILLALYSAMSTVFTLLILWALCGEEQAQRSKKA